MFKSFLKFSLGFLALIALGLGGLLLTTYIDTADIKASALEFFK